MLMYGIFAEWLEPHYRKIESGLIQCRYCERKFLPGNNYDKVIHLRDCQNKTIPQCEEEWRSDTSHFIWEYFTKENTFGAKCKHCPKLISKGYKKCNLYNHIYNHHEEIITALREEITSSWMSKYFSFSTYNAICEKCFEIIGKEVKINIFDDRKNFEKHLFTKHARDVEMLQQPVDEENIAGPSSRHNNTRSDDSSLVVPSVSTLINPLQGELRCETKDNKVEMLQQSVDEGNNAGPSSHHDNTRSNSLPVLPSISPLKNPLKRQRIRKVKIEDVGKDFENDDSC